MDLRSLIRTIPNFPSPGIMFRDVTTLLKDPDGFKFVIDSFASRYKNYNLDMIVGVESRGFIIGSALAYALGLGFVPIRKKGKLPGKTISQSYDLEYGSDIIEIHNDSLDHKSRVLLVDDLLATGGTAIGAANLIKKLGGEVVEACFVIDLPELKGGEKLKSSGINYHYLVNFEGH